MQISCYDAILEYQRYLIVEKGLSKATIDRYYSILLNYNSYLSSNKSVSSVQQITSNDILDFVKFRTNQGLNEKSVHQLISAIRGFHEFCTLEKYCLKNAASTIESPKASKHLPRVLSIEEVKEFLDSIVVSDATSSRNKVMVEVLYATGMRVSELCNLTLGQLHLSQGFIRCIGKGNKERLIPIANYLVLMLQNYIDYDRKELLQKNKSQFLFINKKGKVISRNNFYAILKNLAEKSNITKSIHPHLIRHTFATHLLENGADLRSIQELLGHRNLETTTIYTHVNKQQISIEYNKFHPRGNRKREKS